MQEEAIESYYAHGKLLLSGEYLVLTGARALALPLKYGQKLTLEENHSSFLSWTARTPQGHWFQADYDEALNIKSCDNYQLAEKLASILKICNAYRPDIRDLFQNKQVTTELEFDKDWGWGSSSSLISLLSQWLGVHPYHLLQDTFGGSGYDIACATASSPITYQLVDGIPKVETVEFHPAFSEHIYFVYSGKKQNSSNEIARFEKHLVSQENLQIINHITDQMITCNDLHLFGPLMEQHEKIIGDIVHLNPIKNEHFNDFKGYIKTLGAWGGDFMMVVTDEAEGYVREYFNSKQLTTIFKYNEVKIK